MVTDTATYKRTGNKDRNTVTDWATHDPTRRDLIFAPPAFFCFSADTQLAHWHLPYTQADPSQKPKSQFLSTLKISITNTNNMNRNFYRLAILTFLTIFSGFFFSCNGTKQTTTKNEKTMQTETFQTSYNVSARTKSFLAELEKEISEAGNSIENFKPSDRLIEVYNIRKQSDTYFISGFIKTNEHFDRNGLEQINVTLGQATGIIVTVQVPFKSLSQFLKTEGIEYFEISEKATNN
jgi:hypothetical protein